VTDYRSQFSKWWVSEWKAVAFPEKGLVFDYFVDEAQVRWPGLACVFKKHIS
jgi:dynein heavy chain